MADSDIFVRFGADIDPLKKGVKAAGNKLDEFGKKTRSTVNALGKVAAASALAGAAIGVKLVSDSLNAIDTQAKLARQLGTTSASLATLNRAADMSGISMKSIEAGAKNLDVAMGEAAQGTGEALDTLKRLNITAEDLAGMTLDEKLLKINAALIENIPATERAAAAADLFGKKAGFAISQLSPEGIAEAKRQVEGLGLAISDIDAAKIEAANDSMATMGLAVKGVSNQFTIALAPILNELATSFQEAAMESGGFRDTAVEAVNGIAKAVGFIGNSLFGVGLVIDGIKLAFQGLGVVASMWATQLVENIDFAINSVKKAMNLMIAGLNKIPGIDISKFIVGKGALAESFRAETEAAKVALGLAATELNNKLLQPLPSEQVEIFMQSVRDKNQLELDAESEKIAALAIMNEEGNAAAATLREEATAREAKIAAAQRAKNLSGTQSFFSDLSTLTQSSNKKLFEIGKIAARANVVIDTHESAMKAYKWAAGWGGPIAGSIAAGAAIAAGGIRLSAINSTSFGGGGLAGSGAGAATPAATTSNTAPQAQASSRTIRIEGIDPNQNFSGGQVQNLVEQLREFQEDGGVLVI